MTSLVLIEHCHCLIHREIGRYRRLRRADAVVVVHLKVNEKLPISVGRAILLERILALAVEIEELFMIVL